MTTSMAGASSEPPSKVRRLFDNGKTPAEQRLKPLLDMEQVRKKNLSPWAKVDTRQQEERCNFLCENRDKQQSPRLYAAIFTEWDEPLYKLGGGSARECEDAAWKRETIPAAIPYKEIFREVPGGEGSQQLIRIFTEGDDAWGALCLTGAQQVLLRWGSRKDDSWSLILTGPPASGKSTGAMFPVCAALDRRNKREKLVGQRSEVYKWSVEPMVLILVPTKNFAQDCAEMVEKFLQHMPARVLCLVAGERELQEVVERHTLPGNPHRVQVVCVGVPNSPRVVNMVADRVAKQAQEGNHPANLVVYKFGTSDEGATVAAAGRVTHVAQLIKMTNDVSVLAQPQVPRKASNETQNRAKWELYQGGIHVTRPIRTSIPVDAGTRVPGLARGAWLRFLTFWAVRRPFPFYCYVPRFILETGKIGVITGYLPKKERCSVLIDDESLALSPGNFLLGLQPDVTRRGTIVRLQGQKAAAPWNGAVRRARDFFVQEASGSRYMCVDLGNEMQLNGKPEILCQ
eukprot:g19173.t1